MRWLMALLVLAALHADPPRQEPVVKPEQGPQKPIIYPLPPGIRRSASSRKKTAGAARPRPSVGDLVA
jgi:hypothetical protein